MLIGCLLASLFVMSHWLAWYWLAKNPQLALLVPFIGRSPPRYFRFVRSLHEYLPQLMAGSLIAEAGWLMHQTYWFASWLIVSSWGFDSVAWYRAAACGCRSRANA
jgi:hypothetical protein